VARDWVEVLEGRGLASLASALQQWLPTRRWFRGKARTIESVGIFEHISVPTEGEKTFLLLFRVNYIEGDSEMYVLPIACAFGRRAESIAGKWPQLIVAQVALKRSRKIGLLYDAIVSREFCHALLTLMAQRHKIEGHRGELEPESTGVLQRIRREQGLEIKPKVSKAEQSNSSIIYDSSVILKFFRRIEPGVNPELEIERFLSARNFSHSPRLAGALEYHDDGDRASTLAVLTSFIPGCHDAWEDTLQALNRFYQQVGRLPGKLRLAPPVSQAGSALLSRGPLPQPPRDLIGSYLQDAKTLGRRTASLHLALASDPSDPAFRAEPWNPAAQQSMFESLRDLTRHDLQLLRQRGPTLSPDSQALAQRVMALEPLILRRFEKIIQQPIAAERIRTHGDFHLGQVLHHGSDFLIIDFEGEPAISLEERRSKQSALRDVAGMIYSFFYAANAALQKLPRTQFSRVRSEIQADWARYWSVRVGAAFLRTYLETAGTAPFLPTGELAMKIMLDVELLRKAIYELGYELNNRPDWINVSFRVLLDLLDSENPL
jgi:trehalose synthase-fused probable maltokinase